MTKNSVKNVRSKLAMQTLQRYENWFYYFNCQLKQTFVCWESSVMVFEPSLFHPIPWLFNQHNIWWSIVCIHCLTSKTQLVLPIVDCRTLYFRLRLCESRGCPSLHVKWWGSNTAWIIRQVSLKRRNKRYI